MRYCSSQGIAVDGEEFDENVYSDDDNIANQSVSLKEESHWLLLVVVVSLRVSCRTRSGGRCGCWFTRVKLVGPGEVEH